MKLIRRIWAEAFGLIVDDGALAAQVIAMVLCAAIAVKLMAIPALWVAGMLLPGCLLILAASVARAPKK